MTAPIKIESAVHIDTAETLEDMAIQLQTRVTEQYEKGMEIVSVSHAVDRGDPDGKPYSFMLVTQTANAFS